MKEVEKAVAELDHATQAASSVADRSGALAMQLNGQASKIRELTHELDIAVKGTRIADAGVVHELPSRDSASQARGGRAA